MKIAAYTDLEIWKEGIRLTKEVYLRTKKGEFARDFGLRDQLQKSMVSISSNIAEGFERNSNAEFKKFLTYAKGSVGEAKTQIQIAIEIGYLTSEDGSRLISELHDLGLRIGKLMSRIIEARNS